MFAAHPCDTSETPRPGASSWRGGHGLMSSRGIRRGGGEPHGDMKSPDAIDTESCATVRRGSVSL